MYILILVILTVFLLWLFVCTVGVPLLEEHREYHYVVSYKVIYEIESLNTGYGLCGISKLGKLDSWEDFDGVRKQIVTYSHHLH